MLSLRYLLLLPLLPASAAVEFNSQIRPILAENCFHCHGPDPGTRKAGLRLDTEAGFFTVKDGAAPVVKGDAEKSSLYERLISTDEDEIMPPPETHKKLKPAEIALVKQWISEGAPWQPHWAFIPPQRSELPLTRDKAWAKTALDAFVLAKLESAGLQPNAEATKHTLARRVALDLTGLPPSSELLEAFVKDSSPKAYETLVDQLLKSPAYGEHRARYWLDAARYGDTHGLHFDNYREMWPYRDWVISAFNSNQPFDQFTVEQFAGDLLPKATDEQRVATGFQRCNITTNEGGTIDDENLANYAADRVQTLGWVYLGLTTNCAQCHDHKFDTFTQKDYYALAAFFRNTTQPAKDGNVKDGKSSVLYLPTATDAPRWKALPTEIDTARVKLTALKTAAAPAYARWQTQVKPAELLTQGPKEKLLHHLPLNEGKGSSFTDLANQVIKPVAAGETQWVPGGRLGAAPVVKGRGLAQLPDAADFSADSAFSYGAWVKPAGDKQTGAILSRMDPAPAHRGWDLWQNNKSYAVHIIHEFPKTYLKVSTRDGVKPGQWQHLFITYDGSRKAAGIKIYLDGVEQPRLSIQSNTLPDKADIHSKAALQIGQRGKGQPFEGGAIQDVRLYARQLSAAEVKGIASLSQLPRILALPAAKRNAAQQEQLFSHYLSTQDSAWQQQDRALLALSREQDSIRNRSAMTHVQEERMDSKAMAQVLMRGQYDKPGDSVEAAPPAALHALPESAPRNRLGLAKWLVSKENALTARVTVNRFWQELFGYGLVRTTEDFGIMGAAPSHPELLDWLAVEFQKSGWDVKRLFKLMLMSATYRQATTITPEKLEKDRDNALLSRGPRFRMDAEMLRDLALSASGTLSGKLGGPPVKPYQPEGIWDVVGLPGGDTRNYTQDTGESLYRRSLYTFWKRMAPPPNLETFNAPSRETSCVRRERTNTPLQALVTLNDPTFVEACRNLAQLALKTAQPLDTMATRLLSRPLTEKERSVLDSNLAELTAHYVLQPEDAAALLSVGESPRDKTLPPASHAALTLVASQLLNLDEVLTK